MPIKLLTFKTNHTILADVEAVGGEYVLKQPVQVVVQPTQSGPSLAFVPFVEFCVEFKSGIKVNKSDVLFESTPVVELENQYSKLFGVGIEIASVIPKM
jgi:hypothetical protein